MVEEEEEGGDFDNEENRLLETWHNHPNLKRTLRFPTWIVPSAHCQKLLSSPLLQEHLGREENIQPRIRIARSYRPKDDDSEGTGQVLLLRNPAAPPLSSDTLEALWKSLDHDDDDDDNDDDDDGGKSTAVGSLLRDGPVVEIPVTHRNWTVSHILKQLLPVRVHPPPTAFEQVGHVAHLNLREAHLAYGRLIGNVLCECHGSQIKTVVNKVGEVSGKHRTYQMDLLAGRPDYNVRVLENGVTLRFDLSKVYWCSRLSGERKYLIQHEFRSGETIADPFCGVGALCLQTKRHLPSCIVWANDWNPHAVEAFEENARSHKVRVEKLECRDADEFLMDLGLLHGHELPHHVVMNYPLEATKFLPALRWWPTKPTDRKTMVHIYTFARADPSTNRSVLDVAVDQVADGLLPTPEPCPGDGEHLNELGCNVRARLVRDVSPNKVVVCVSFEVTQRLLRHMQGDYV